MDNAFSGQVPFAGAPSPGQSAEPTKCQGFAPGLRSGMHKAGWNVDFLGQIASYDTAIATAPGDVAEGFYAMSPSLYAYPDDLRPEVQALMKRFKDKYGFDINYLGQTGYVSAQIATEALRRAGRDLTLDSLIAGMESLKDFKDIFGATYTFTPTDHHGTTKAFLSVVHKERWLPVMPEALAY